MADARAVLNSVCLTRVTFTRPTPFAVRPIFCAARCERSRLRPRTNGPRSLMRTLTERPFETLVTCTTEPSGSVGEAAVSWLGSNRSPLDVRRPLNPGPYHEAVTTPGDRGYPCPT
jgi:hypothetical protein